MKHVCEITHVIYAWHACVTYVISHTCVTCMATHVSHACHACDTYDTCVPRMCHRHVISHVWMVSPKYLIFNQFILQLKNICETCVNLHACVTWCGTHVKHACYHMPVTCVAFLSHSHACDTHMKHMCHMRGIFAGVISSCSNPFLFKCVRFFMWPV